MDIPSGLLTEPAEYLAFWRTAITLLCLIGIVNVVFLAGVAVMLGRILEQLVRLGN